MVSQALTIARNTFLESVRQPIYFVLVMLAGLCMLFTTWSAAFSMGLTESGEVSGDNKLLLDIGLATVFVAGTLLAAFIATAVISREIENKTVLTVVSKPVARPTLILGKYLGVSSALLIAVLTMILFLLMGIRHGVLSTASDDPDGPVIFFSLLAVGGALALGIWGNFFYGWVFTQTATLAMLPLMAVAWIVVLFLDKHWKVQPLLTDVKPQILMAATGVVLALLVLSAIALATSTRLGQVMTVVICGGVFLLGLLSNHFLGRFALQNTFVTQIESAQPVMPSQITLDNTGDAYTIKLRLTPRKPVPPGSSFYYGPNPNGFDLRVASFAPFQGDVTNQEQLRDRNRPPAIVVTDLKDKTLTVQRIGAGVEDDGPSRSIVRQLPQPDDYVFIRPTTYNPAGLALWGIVPNIQSFWLVDAVSQNQFIPLRHLGLVALYALAQIGVFLSLAVILFQRREVG